MDSVVLHISSKSGGLKWMVKSSFHFQLEHIAYSSEYILEKPPKDLEEGFATQNMFMGGI
ncbi:hypothetical protein TSUD_186400 [Trifolium subterraneum]|uniref:Uncharacterized protein n=1 Tax=Trifolium subterraneum TaxID=3900 RepID=A0A2Z6NS32_TRISU|nr:hypothetical protein TSUD_186400 [Trifolium subterraneum]